MLSYLGVEIIKKSHFPFRPVSYNLHSKYWHYNNPKLSKKFQNWHFSRAEFQSNRIMLIGRISASGLGLSGAFPRLNDKGSKDFKPRSSRSWTIFLTVNSQIWAENSSISVRRLVQEVASENSGRKMDLLIVNNRLLIKFYIRTFLIFEK